MLRPRIIPCLLIHRGGLVKTVKFGAPKYVGDPINAIRIFNEKEVDELMVIDIDATVEGRAPDFETIAHLAAECNMPLSYGGGVTHVDHAQRLIALGVEKVAMSSAALVKPDLLGDIAVRLGRQSVVAVLDVKPSADQPSGYDVWTHNGTRATGRCVVQAAIEVQRAGAGELVINAIHRDGTMEGFDLELVERVRAVTHVPLTVLGGAGSLAHLRALIQQCGIVGAAAGSLFVFKGPYRAVLISYPGLVQRESLRG